MTEFTKYGKALAAEETIPERHPLGGATAHMAACAYDSGITVRLIGKDAYGKTFTNSAKSVYGAYNTAKAVWGIHSAWHIRADGSRKLIFRS
jgi:hypothetical protein